MNYYRFMLNSCNGSRDNSQIWDWPIATNVDCQLWEWRLWEWKYFCRGPWQIEADKLDIKNVEPYLNCLLVQFPVPWSWIYLFHHRFKAVILRNMTMQTTQYLVGVGRGHIFQIQRYISDSVPKMHLKKEFNFCWIKRIWRAPDALWPREKSTRPYLPTLPLKVAGLPMCFTIAVNQFSKLIIWKLYI